MIRPAGPQDITAILQLGLECHAVAATKVPVDEMTARRVIAQVIHGMQYFAWVKEVDGELLGCLLGGTDMIWYNPKKREASDLLFYVRPDPRAVGAGRMLLKRFMRWGIERKVARFAMAVSFGGNTARRTGKIYEKEGFEQVGGMYYWHKQDGGKRS